MKYPHHLVKVLITQFWTHQRKNIMFSAKHYRTLWQQPLPFGYRYWTPQSHTMSQQLALVGVPVHYTMPTISTKTAEFEVALNQGLMISSIMFSNKSQHDEYHMYLLQCQRKNTIPTNKVSRTVLLLAS